METTSNTSVSRTEDSQTNHTEYKEIISTLPKNNSSELSEPLHEYQGFWYIASFLEGIMSAQEHFIAQSTDIFICSHPKSGSTWLKSLCFSILTRTHFSDSSPSPLLSNFPHDIVPYIEFLAYNGITRDPQLPLLATHISYNSLPKSIVESNCKIIYICRDAKDLLISLWHFSAKASGRSIEDYPLEKVFQNFCEGVSVNGPYWDHVLGYWKASLQFPEKVLFIKYEELKNDTFFYVKRLAEFMGSSFSIEEHRQGLVQKIVEFCNFENLSNLEVNKSESHGSVSIMKIPNKAFFREGKVGDWKNYLTAEMAAQIDQITQHKFKGSGLLA